MKQPDICLPCLRALLFDRLERKCELCGAEYLDRETQQQIVALKD